ncbi:glycosyltransferase [Silicimonas algicola]|uniref:GT2 family glycosyltransferase n=1 Tax=Silicimonas algicola TaxID=1826607 RepID=A0A316FVE8_9RHOB|nr:glycosyltransferase [Silicimonas algicola]AZQ67607.1 glycosyltransferase [Silicimonas algicola]PWK52764.1 GT2 family glycosyltransferase [Silicimonas algicola]
MASVSIVVPTFNRPKLLPRAVRSALLACPEDGQVVVVDDHSVIPAISVLKDISDTRLRVITNGYEKGASGARNFGVFSAFGDAIFFLDDDDEMLPNYCLRVMKSGFHGSLAGYCAIEHVELDGSTQTISRRGLDRGLIPDSASMRKKIAGLQMGFWIRKDVFQELGCLDPLLTTDEDTDFTIRMCSENIGLWYDPDPGVRQYSHLTANKGGQLTKTTPKDVVARNYLRTLSKNHATFPPMHKARWFLLSRFLRRAIEAHEYRLAWRVAMDIKPLYLSICGIAFLSVKTIARPRRHLTSTLINRLFIQR